MTDIRLDLCSSPSNQWCTTARLVMRAVSVCWWALWCRVSEQRLPRSSGHWLFFLSRPSAQLRVGPRPLVLAGVQVRRGRPLTDPDVQNLQKLTPCVSCSRSFSVAIHTSGSSSAGIFSCASGWQSAARNCVRAESREGKTAGLHVDLTRVLKFSLVTIYRYYMIYYMIYYI